MDNLFFGLDKPASDENLVLLRTFHDDVSVLMAAEVLRDENVPFVRKDRGSGSAVRLITGYSMYGTDLLVLPEDLEKASALMAELFNPDNYITDDEDPEQEDSEDEQ